MPVHKTYTMFDHCHSRFYQVTMAANYFHIFFSPGKNNKEKSGQPIHTFQYCLLVRTITRFTKTVFSRRHAVFLFPLVSVTNMNRFELLVLNILTPKRSQMVAVVVRMGNHCVPKQILPRQDIENVDSRVKNSVQGYRKLDLKKCRIRIGNDKVVLRSKGSAINDKSEECHRRLQLYPTTRVTKTCFVVYS